MKSLSKTYYNSESVKNVELNLDNEITRVEMLIPIQTHEEEVSEVVDVNRLKDERDDILNTYKDIIENRIVILSDGVETVPLIPTLIAGKKEIAPEIKIMNKQMEYDFDQVEIIFGALLEKDIYFKFVELNLKLEDSKSAGVRKARFFKLYPENKYQDVFKASFSGKVGIDAGLKFKIEVPLKIQEMFDIKIDPAIELKTEVDYDAGEIKYRKAKIESIGESNSQAIWRYYMTHQDYVNDDYKTIVILKIPRETAELTLYAELKVVPMKVSWFFPDELLEPIILTKEYKLR